MCSTGRRVVSCKNQRAANPWAGARGTAHALTSRVAQRSLHMRELGVAPHVTKNDKGRSSNLDRRTTRQPGYAVSLSRRWLQRFHSCYIPKPLLQSGIFLKKMPPSAASARAHQLWNRSNRKKLRLNEAGRAAASGEAARARQGGLAVRLHLHTTCCDCRD